MQTPTPTFRLFIAASVMGILVLMSSFSGCKTGKEITETAVNSATAPDWVNTRPVASGYYIGLGSCSKVAQPADYQNIAKKNALNDLATEISVRVQGETFLNTMEVNKNFTEDFMSTISTTTDAKIEDYEIAGTWEDKQTYFVYYRLNKAQYQHAKQTKKNMTMAAAHDYYLKGRDAELVNNLTIAFELYTRGLVLMQEYWNDVNKYRTDSAEIYLDGELYRSMQRIANGIQLQPKVSKIILSSENEFNGNLHVVALYNNKPVSGIGVFSNYEKPRYTKPRNQLTNDEGAIYVAVNDIDPKIKTNVVKLSIDIEAFMPSDIDKKLANGLLKTMRGDKKEVPIEFVAPSFYIASEEKQYQSVTTQKTLQAAFANNLVQQGMRLSDRKAESNYQVQITANTTEGGTAQGFVVAYLDLTMTVTKTNSGEVVYSESIPALKGLQLTREAASIDAYKKAKDKIDAEIVSSVLASIL
jgi:LPP20 lipoprotein